VRKPQLGLDQVIVTFLDLLGGDGTSTAEDYLVEKKRLKRLHKFT
jgi:hypothetical protein